MMRILLLETSGTAGHVGLAVGDDLLAQRRLDEGQKHCRDLAPTVQALLLEQGWKPGDVQAVVVSLGPGSYTGLRVGVMAAKAFAYALGCKLVGVPTLPVLALAALAHQPQIEVIEDAQQGRVYSQRFRLGANGLPEEATSLVVLENEAWLAHLDPAFALVGPGLKKKHDSLASSQPLLPSDLWTPALAPLLRLGRARLEANQADDPMMLEPIYARASAAESQWTALGR